MRTLILAFILLMRVSGLFASGYQPAAGAASTALGGIGLNVNNAFAPANHAALMPWQKEKLVAASFLNRYGLKDVNQFYLTAVVPHQTFGYGFKFYHNGNNTYQENSIGLSAAHAFHPHFSLGVGIHYNTINITGYGHRYFLTADMSVAAKVTEQLSLGFRAMNPNRTQLTDKPDERVGSLYQAGLAYMVNKQVNTYVQIEKQNAFQPSFKCGMDYAPKENLHLRMGFSAIQPQYSFGVGFKHKKYHLEWASLIHQTLGLSSNLSFIFEM